MKCEHCKTQDKKWEYSMVWTGKDGIILCPPCLQNFRGE